METGKQVDVIEDVNIKERKYSRHLTDREKIFIVKNKYKYYRSDLAKCFNVCLRTISRCWNQK
jgi:hypothetical protein